MSVKQKIFLISYGSLLSCGIAVIAFIFLIAEGFSSELLWHTLPHYFKWDVLYKAVLCIVGATIVYFCKRKWGNVPRTSHERLHELQASQRVSYRYTINDLITSLMILSFGAGVGPEATLLGAIIAFSIWQADKLRYVRWNFDDICKSSFRQRMNYLFHPQKYLLPYKKEDSLKNRKIFIAFFIINGLALFMLLMKMTDQPSFITKIGVSHWDMRDALILLPLVLYGYIVGMLYNFLSKNLKRFLERLNLPLWAKIGSGMVSIFVIATFMPVLLFSGQHSLPTAVKLGMVTPVAILILLSFAKLLFLDICVWSGWIGGDIFPITFASILHGFAVAQVLNTHDELFVIAVVAVSFAITLLQKEWLAGIFISLFFPIDLLPVLFCVVVLFVVKNKFIKN